MPLLSDYPQLKIIQDLARKKKVQAYLVGGFLRDALLGLEKQDFDFAVEKGALRLAKSFATKIKGAYVLLDEERGCARVAKKARGQLFTFDFADFRDKTFKKDLAARDFTINTLSVDLSHLKAKAELDDVLMDLKGGLKDIKLKKITYVSAKAFKDDPLRMMRAFSLKATLGFKIDQKTLKQIQKDKNLIDEVSSERIREELFKILETDHSVEEIKVMDRIGLLEAIIPEVKVMATCRQGTYHHLDVWPHSVETLLQLEGIFNQFGANKDLAVYLGTSLGGSRSRWALLKLAALLHDIGKPDTKRIEKGRTSFHGHEHVGKMVVKNIAKSLKLSIRERRALEDMVRWHLRPGYLSNFKKPSEKAIYRYFRDTREEAVSTALLSLADQRATRGPATSQQDQVHHEHICLDLLDRYFQKKKEKPFRRLISGDDLIRQLKLKPSPLFSKILSAVEEKQMLGELKTKKDAIVCAKEIAAKMK